MKIIHCYHPTIPVRIERGEDIQGTPPAQYLLVTHNPTGTRWVCPITARQRLDIEKRIAEWVKREFCGELRIDLPICTGAGRDLCDYHAAIITDKRPVDSVVVWDSAGFFLKTTH